MGMQQTGFIKRKIHMQRFLLEESEGDSYNGGKDVRSFGYWSRDEQ